MTILVKTNKSSAHQDEMTCRQSNPGFRRNHNTASGLNNYRKKITIYMIHHAEITLTCGRTQTYILQFYFKLLRIKLIGS